jgi:hypothetical protein
MPEGDFSTGNAQLNFRFSFSKQQLIILNCTFMGFDGKIIYTPFKFHELKYYTGKYDVQIG